MRCSCRVCGTYMVQAERGLESGCVCPECGSVCKDCMGSVQQPLSVAELGALYALGIIEDYPEEEETAPPETRDWHREL